MCSNSENSMTKYQGVPEKQDDKVLRKDLAKKNYCDNPNYEEAQENLHKFRAKKFGGEPLSPAEINQACNELKEHWKEWFTDV